jgi:hypothetical protein
MNDRKPYVPVPYQIHAHFPNVRVSIFVNGLEIALRRVQDNLGVKKVLAPRNRRLCVLPA